ncbi:MAG: hypothetical protein ACOY3D_05005 [Candidatus Omnitrophota bacterium]
MKRILFLSLIFTVNVLLCFAAESRVELTDGGVIKGEVIALADGVYTIKSAALGEMKIPAEKVLRIEPAEGTSAGSMSSQMEAYKAKILNNAEIMNMISRLAAQPQIQEMVKDPQIQSSAKSGDIQTLLKNKKFTDFVNSPEVQKITNKLKE